MLYASVSPLAVPGTQDYVTLILLLTLLAGIFQWLLGMLRFGALVNFVSHAVVLGFTLGAAVVIALGQLPNLLGLEVPPSNGRACALFIREGFVEVGRRKGYYPAPDGREDALVMRRNIDLGGATRAVD